MKIFRRCSFCRIFLTVHALLLLPKECCATTQSVKVEQMTSYFERQGYVVLRNFFPASQLEVWQQTAQQFFGSVFEILHEKGHTAFPHHSRLVRNSDGAQTREYAMQGGRKHGFREIVMRSNGRYEISLDALATFSKHHQEELPTLNDLVQKLSSITSPLLHTTLFNMSMTTSLIVSTPGAADQSWHADGDHWNLDRHEPCHCLNVFIPLLNITSTQLGPTDLVPTSHYITRQPSPMRIDPTTLPKPYAPLLNMGDTLVFDYRLLHRGLANQEFPHSNNNTNRPLLVLTFSQKWFQDNKNWPLRSLADS